MKKLAFIFFFLSIYFPASAQFLLGISQSNYADIHGVLANPSYLADTRHRLSINLGSTSGYIYSSYFKNSLAKGFYLPTSMPFNEELLSNAFLREPGNGIAGNINLQSEIRGISALIKLTPDIGIAITTRIRGFVLGEDIPNDISKAFMYGFDDTDFTPQSFSDKKLNLHQSLFSEVGFSYGQTIFNSGVHFLKSGITTKYIHGIQTSFLQTSALDYETQEDRIRIESAEFEFGYSTDEEIPVSFSNLFFSPDNFGIGWGVDVGFTYEYRPQIDSFQYYMNGKEIIDHGKNKYLFKIGLSLLDLGYIYYNNPSARNFSGNISGANLNNRVVNDFYNSPLTGLNSFLQTEDPGRSVPFTTRLPTTLNFNFDYYLKKNFYLNLTWINGFKSKNAEDIYQNSLVAITPRYEHTAYEFSLPIALNHNYKQMTVGAAVRGGPVFIGLDNLGGLLGIGKAKGSFVYAGVGFYLPDKKSKDSDGDGVSDEMDECPDIPGTWRFNGCPDTDGDGIEDRIDACPTEPGFVELNGCPDSDGDGLIDKDDACPNSNGPIENQGCVFPLSELTLKSLSQEEIDLLNQAEQNLTVTGDSISSEKARITLDSISTIMNQDPDTKLAIIIIQPDDHHVSDASTQNQAEKDVKIIENYLIGKGINPEKLLEDRISQNKLSERFSYNKSSRIILRLITTTP